MHISKRRSIKFLTYVTAISITTIVFIILIWYGKGLNEEDYAYMDEGLVIKKESKDDSFLKSYKVVIYTSDELFHINVSEDLYNKIELGTYEDIRVVKGVARIVESDKKSG
ncbi:hypothetical protein MUN88_10330 [Gracilibacillus caseinilyticus]|uniref:Uncharacterized protein n=1 Tax=Gracilibacillus caseinilyticus TaxID=2932256 RepID=A0ABY4F1K5_9BACI|nr:hypothetical protein [Gracilibacillus caseinilyticus]UOQ50413.1 hypothetical protein MUN88_10330 [Gracilibacillus caseinilyticus]